jgi:hypothetical protein
MDKTTLVGPDLNEGRRFLDLLKTAGIPVNAALWQKAEIVGRWELVVVTPLVEELGVRKTYDRLDKVLAKSAERPAVELVNVSVLTPESWFYKSLHRDLHNAQDLPITRRQVGDHIIDDGFIYFVK